MTSNSTYPFSWNSFSFKSYNINPARWSGVSGVYAFSPHYALPLSGNWQPIYIGQTKDLYQRLEHHKKLPSALRLGLQVIHVTPIPFKDTRDLLEQQMIKQFQPPLNIQHKQHPLGLGINLKQTASNNAPKLGLSLFNKP